MFLKVQFFFNGANSTNLMYKLASWLVDPDAVS